MTGPLGEDPELREIFARDASERLDRIVEMALALERRPDDAETIGQLLRDFHTIKGSAQLVSLTHVPALAHRLEDQLSELRSGTRELAPGETDAILTAADALGQMIPLELAGEPVQALAEPALAALAALAPTTPAAPTPPTPPAPPTPPTPPTPTPTGDATPDHPAAAPDHPVATLDHPAAAPAETVAVSLDRLDRLVRLAGEAITARLRLDDLAPADRRDDPDRQEASLALARTLESIQTEALAARMTTVGSLSGALRRAVREAARASGKTAAVVMVGEAAELDRAVLNRLREPLLHLVRNAVAHGLESPADRRRAGKPASGEVRVEARRRGGELSLTVTDDGEGLDLSALRRRAERPDLDDTEAAALIFRPGLSTAPGVDELSGRGVGMDIVRATVEALRGRVQVASNPGVGTRFTLTVPATLAIVPCLIIEAGGERYGLPTHAVSSVVEASAATAVGLEGRRALWVGEEIVTLSPLAALTGAGTPAGDGAASSGPALVLASGDSRAAVRVDAVLGQRHLTVTELGGVLAPLPLLAGSTIEPDGSVMLVLEPEAVLARAYAHRDRTAVPASPTSTAGAATATAAPAVTAAPGAPAAPGAAILVVDDALTVRELQRAMLARAGYEVETAVDGEDALTAIARRRPDLVITDIDMPKLDGLALLRRIRATPAIASLPVMIVTSHGSAEERISGLHAGADAYLVKQEFDEPALLEAVARLLGTPR